MQSFVPVWRPIPASASAGSSVTGSSLSWKTGGQGPPQGWRALLRTNLGPAADLRREILQAHTRALTPAGSSWRDLPMHWDETGWSLELPLTEVGYFKAKAYAVDARGWQHWPEGPDVGISVHPDQYRTGKHPVLRVYSTVRTGPRGCDQRLMQR